MKQPLSNGFTAFAIILFIISLFATLFSKVNPAYGFLFIVVSIIFIISSLTSIYPDDDF